MGRFAALTGLELRERWISFRLLTAVAILVATTAPMLLLEPSLGANLAGAPPDRLQWLAIATAAALALVAGVEAVAVGRARRSGSAGWLVVRAVPRPSVVLSWFAADAVVLALGLIPTAALVWAAGGSEVNAPGAATLAAVYLGIYVLGLTALTLAILAGLLLPSLVAALLTLGIVGGTLTACLLAIGASVAGVALPSAPLNVLAEVDSASRPIATSLAGAGSSLVVASVTLVLALAAVRGSDL